MVPWGTHTVGQPDPACPLLGGACQGSSFDPNFCCWGDGATVGVSRLGLMECINGRRGCGYGFHDSLIGIRGGIGGSAWAIQDLVATTAFIRGGGVGAKGFNCLDSFSFNSKLRFHGISKVSLYQCRGGNGRGSEFVRVDLFIAGPSLFFGAFLLALARPFSVAKGTFTSEGIHLALVA